MSDAHWIEESVKVRGRFLLLQFKPYNTSLPLSTR